MPRSKTNRARARLGCDVEINSDDATNVDENDDAVLSGQGNRELEDLVTSAGIDDLADTYRSMEPNEIIREARALISDEDGNVRNLNNPEEVEAFINDILDEEGEGDTDSLNPSSNLGAEDVSWDGSSTGRENVATFYDGECTCIPKVRF